MILDRTVRIAFGLSAIFLIFSLSKDYGAASMYVSPQHASEAIRESPILPEVHSKGFPVANLKPTPFQETSVGQLYSGGCDWEELSRNHQIFGFSHFYQNQDLVDSPADNPNSERFSNAQDSSTSSRHFEDFRENISASEGPRAQLPVEENNIDKSDSPAAGLSGEQGPRQILESSSQIMGKSGEPPSNRVHNRNERCEPENASPYETQCSKRKEGNVQKDEPNTSKKKKMLVKKLHEGSRVSEKAGRLSGATETNHEIHSFLSTSGESNFPSSKKTSSGKSRLSATQIVERLRNMGKIHVEDITNFEDIDLFSKVQNLSDKSLLKVCQGNTPEKNKDTVLRLMKKLINSFVGLVGAWCDLERSEGYETRMTSAWYFVQKYLSTWIDAKNIGEKVTECRDDLFDGIMPFEDYMANIISGKKTFDVQICYQLWTGWLKEQKLTKYLVPFDKFTCKLREIIKNHGTEKTQNQSPETAQPLDFWEFTSRVARAHRENGVGSSQYRLVEEGKNLDGPWVKSRRKLEEYVAKTTEKIFSEVTMIKTGTEGERMNPKGPIFEEHPYYKGRSTKPANVQKRVVENFNGRTLPAFLGFVRRLNIRSGGEEKENVILESSLEFIRELINEWKKFDYIEMLTSKISEPRQTEETDPNQIHNELIAEKLFWNAAFPNTRLCLPTGLLIEIAKQWAKKNAESGKRLKVYLLEEEEFNKTFYGRGKQKPHLKRLFEDDPAGKEPNKSQSGQGKKASGSKRPRLNPLEG